MKAGGGGMEEGRTEGAERKKEGGKEARRKEGRRIREKSKECKDTGRK